MSNEKVQRLGLYEQTLTQLLNQKKQLQSQMVELDSALAALQDEKEAYKIIGNVMVRHDAKTLKADIEEKKKALSIRLKSCEKQEESTREKASALQKEVMADMQE